jgi:hypothetical protein
MSLETYKSSGELVTTRIVDESDGSYIQLRDFLLKENDGWERSIVSYKSSPYVFRSDGKIVRCYANFIVIDQFAEGQSLSYRKMIPDVLGKLGLTK